MSEPAPFDVDQLSRPELEAVVVELSQATTALTALCTTAAELAVGAAPERVDPEWAVRFANLLFGELKRVADAHCERIEMLKVRSQGAA